MPKSRDAIRNEQLSQSLRVARRQAGLTQVQVAKRLHKDESYVSNVESGKCQIGVVELSDFCLVYGVQLSTFLKRAGFVYV